MRAKTHILMNQLRTHVQDLIWIEFPCLMTRLFVLGKEPHIEVLRGLVFYHIPFIDVKSKIILALVIEEENVHEQLCRLRTIYL